VRFNVSGPVGDEIYECKGCMSKYHIDELWICGLIQEFIIYFNLQYKLWIFML
jgi:hypothetical protein